eukprot:gene9251-11336_t
MKVIVVPVLTDNYSYLLIDEKTNTAAAIDPAEPEKVFAAAKQNNVEIKHILTTHHHMDHAGGNEQIARMHPSIRIHGGDSRILAINTPVLLNNDIINVGLLNVKVLTSPAHTTGHVLYYINDNNDSKESCVFTGDTLFIAGCGRLFEGNPQQMYHALYNVIGNLPDDTKVYCGHEYTLNNLRFAKSIDKDNKDIDDMMEWSREQVSSNKPTVPSSVGLEKKINPFMRSHLLGKSLGIENMTTPEILGHIRSLKDKF